MPVSEPLDISKMAEYMPAVYEEFKELCNLLEKHYRDVQDIEFTVERGKLYLLQTRSGKRTAAAAVKTAVNMAQEGLIDRKEALLRVDPAQLDQLLHRRVDPSAKPDALAKGLPVSPGAASGKIVFNADEAEKMAEDGEKVILVRPETTLMIFTVLWPPRGAHQPRRDDQPRCSGGARMGKCCCRLRGFENRFVCRDNDCRRAGFQERRHYIHRRFHRRSFCRRSTHD